MNRIEHLLMCVAEEAGEVTQAAGKAGRFGLTDSPPGGGLQNVDYMVRELNDLLAIFELLQEEGAQITGIGDRQAIHEKKQKVREFMLYAQYRGALDAPQDAIKEMILSMEKSGNGHDMGAQKDWLACHHWLYHWAKTGAFLWHPGSTEAPK